MVHQVCKPKDPATIKIIDAAMNRWGKEDDGLGFVPWVGEKYGVNGLFGAKKILVLGDSHYDVCRQCARLKTSPYRGFTCWCIAEVIDGTDRNPHWTKTAGALTGQLLNNEEKSLFWQSIAYANLVQKMVGYKEDGARAPRPTKEMYVEGQIAFEKMATRLAPNYIVVLGFNLWQRLPSQEDGKYRCIGSGPHAYDKLECYEYSYGGKKMNALRVLHPARGLGRTWRPVLKQAMNM